MALAAAFLLAIAIVMLRGVVPGLGVGGIGSAILSKAPVEMSLDLTTPERDYTLLDSLASVLVKILVLIVEMVVAFAISYVAFMRMDIR